MAPTPPHSRDGHPAPREPGRPATVWPCHPGGGHAGPPAASWLAVAVVKTVASCTRRGDAVLLLSPPPTGVTLPAAEGGPAAAVSRAEHGPRADPGDAAGAVGRLGRGVWTGAVALLAGLAAHPADHPPEPTESESGPGPAGRIAPGPGGSGGPDRFTLVLTVADPAETGWVGTVAWDALLTPTGTLAVLTHSDSRGGRLADPSAALAVAAGQAGLVLAGRVVLVEIPIRGGQLTPEPPPGGQDEPAAPLAGGRAAGRVHSDLLLFTPAVVLAGTSGTTEARR